MSQVIRVLVILQLLDWGSLRYFSARERNSRSTGVFAISFLLAKHCEPQSSSAKLLLPTIPLALTLFWDNLFETAVLLFC